MALVSLMVSPRWRLVLMLLAIYNFNLSTATKCNGHAVAELHEEVLQFNETAKTHCRQNYMEYPEEENCTALYFRNGLNRLSTVCSPNTLQALIMRFAEEDCLQDFGNVKYQKCKQKPTPMEFQQHLQALSVQLNNLARVNVRQRT